MAQMVKCLPAMQETQVWCLGWEDPLEKEMVTHSSILAWKIPWTEEPGRLQSMASQRVGHDWGTSQFKIHKNGTGNEDNGDLLQKVPCTALPHSVPQTLQQATTDLSLHPRFLDTQRQIRASLLWGHCSCLWVLVHTRLCLCPPIIVCLPSPVEVL